VKLIQTLKPSFCKAHCLPLVLNIAFYTFRSSF